ncbi:MAG: RNA polymerase sigma-70 factor [Bacteroidales bacterium]|nr:RNA polymerase sigma-70 factor [Bacteroidales bacterium]
MGEGFDYKDFYLTWYSRSKAFAREYVGDVMEAENIVQEVFLQIYQRRKSFPEDINWVSYLFTAIKNHCLDYLKNRLRRRTLSYDGYDRQAVDTLRMQALEQLDVDFPDQNRIQERIEKALSALPDRCRQVFVMNKLEGKKQNDIAAELGISVNTVESQMAKAYKILREELKDCIPILFFLLNIF